MVSRRQVVQLSLADGSRGTGFLVAPTKLVTALHVVAELDVAGNFVLDGLRPQPIGSVTCVYVTDAREPWSDESIGFDPETDPHSVDEDWVVLTVAQAPAGAVWDCAVLTEDCRGHSCWTFGFPGNAAEQGTSALGTLLACGEPHPGPSRSRFHSASFDLLSSATGFDPRGFSGGPIVVAGKVVGLVRAVPDAGRRVPTADGLPWGPRPVLAEGGLVYAVPIEAVLAAAGLPLAEELAKPESRSADVVFEGPGVTVARCVPFFRGRDEELVQLERLLDSDASTVCVVATGIGGVGKTALVREFVARRAAERFPDGAVWLDAAKLIAELTRVSARFGWARSHAPTPDEAVAFLNRTLADRRVLIVVDDLAPELGRGEPGQVPQPGGGCRTLVTSRMRSLDIALEAVSLELGVWTARACREYLCARCGGLDLADEQLDALLDFVGHLPLAVRLLVSLIRRRSGTSLAELLKLLRAQPLGVLERYAQDPGVVATFQLGYAALEEESRRVLGALAVCASQTRVEVVAAVANVEAALACLDELHDRGFAELWREADSVSRWGVHEVVRMFVLAQPGSEEFVVAHQRWVQARVRQHSEQRQPELATAVDEVWAACERLLRTDVGQAYSLYLPLVDHLRVVGRYAEALALSESMFVAAPAESPFAAIALTYQGELHRTLGATAKAIEFHERAGSIFEIIGDVTNQAVCLGNLGACYQALGRIEHAIELHLRALDMHGRVGPLEGQANRLSSLGLCYASLGELPGAIQHHERALSIYEMLDHREGQAKQLGNLGDCYRVRGEVDKAIEYHERALAIYERLGHVDGRTTALGNLGACYQMRGEHDKAKDHLERCLMTFEELGNLEGQAITHVNLGTCHRHRGEHDAAVGHDECAVAIFERTEHLEGQANANANLGLIASEYGDFERARDYLERGIALHQRMGVAPGHATLRHCERALATVLRHLGS